MNGILVYSMSFRNIYHCDKTQKSAREEKEFMKVVFVVRMLIKEWLAYACTLSHKAVNREDKRSRR